MDPDIEAMKMALYRLRSALADSGPGYAPR